MAPDEAGRNKAYDSYHAWLSMSHLLKGFGGFDHCKKGRFWQANDLYCEMQSIPDH